MLGARGRLSNDRGKQSYAHESARPVLQGENEISKFHVELFHYGQQEIRNTGDGDRIPRDADR